MIHPWVYLSLVEETRLDHLSALINTFLFVTNWASYDLSNQDSSQCIASTFGKLLVQDKSCPLLGKWSSPGWSNNDCDDLPATTLQCCDLDNVALYLNKEKTKKEKKKEEEEEKEEKRKPL